MEQFPEKDITGFIEENQILSKQLEQYKTLVSEIEDRIKELEIELMSYCTAQDKLVASEKITEFRSILQKHKLGVKE